MRSINPQHLHFAAYTDPEKASLVWQKAVEKADALGIETDDAKPLEFLKSGAGFNASALLLWIESVSEPAKGDPLDVVSEKVNQIALLASFVATVRDKV